MDLYLKGEIRADAPALLVICRYLATHPDGVSELDLQRALQPNRPGRFSENAPDGSVIAAALKVGEDLALFSRPNPTSRNWSVDPSLQGYFANTATLNSGFGAPLVLQRLGARALRAVEAGDLPPDLAVALAWFLQQDPLTPFSARWGETPGSALRPPEATLGSAWRERRDQQPIQGQEQWNAFMRWAGSLGLAVRTTLGERREALTPDPTRAITDVVADLPRHAAAQEWFRELFGLLPILGGRALATTVPDLARTDRTIPAATVLAVTRLEHAGTLKLGESADSTSAVTLQLGARERRISDVSIVEARQ